MLVTTKHDDPKGRRRARAMVDVVKNAARGAAGTSSSAAHARTSERWKDALVRSRVPEKRIEVQQMDHG